MLAVPFPWNFPAPFQITLWLPLYSCPVSAQISASQGGPPCLSPKPFLFLCLCVVFSLSDHNSLTLCFLCVSPSLKVLSCLQPGLVSFLSLLYPWYPEWCLVFGWGLAGRVNECVTISKVDFHKSVSFKQLDLIIFLEKISKKKKREKCMEVYGVNSSQVC